MLYPSNMRKEYSEVDIVEERFGRTGCWSRGMFFSRFLLTAPVTETFLVINCTLEMVMLHSHTREVDYHLVYVYMMCCVSRVRLAVASPPRYTRLSFGIPTHR